MATIETELTKVQLHREGAIALLKEARRAFDNGAVELFCSDDESQRPTIAACTEIIGWLDGRVDSCRWPHEDTPRGRQQEWFAEFEFTAETMEWLRWDRNQQVGFMADLDGGVTAGDPGYHAEQVFLLHVLNGIVGPEAVTV